jgi:hypothetical protein
MHYKYYRFPSKEDVPQNWPEEVSVSEIGLIMKSMPVFNELGKEIIPAVFLEGWHVNVCFQTFVDLDFIKKYEINVATPRQKWFGQ